ncbi:MAG TPA: microviridin/marinostatin family tricyclic proteinase inhibitor [Archangium sp.]|nr:microviridin/marinostatin family tricyclic proteinase inhibitor [Archangium sp.]
MKKDTTKKPFFARLLEDQELDQVTGGGSVTLKYPSDGDDTNAQVPRDGTLKHPSDTDELEGSI